MKLDYIRVTGGSPVLTEYCATVISPLDALFRDNMTSIKDIKPHTKAVHLKPGDYFRLTHFTFMFLQHVHECHCISSWSVQSLETLFVWLTLLLGWFMDSFSQTWSVTRWQCILYAFESGIYLPRWSLQRYHWSNRSNYWPIMPRPRYRNQLVIHLCFHNASCQCCKLLLWLMVLSLDG